MTDNFRLIQQLWKENNKKIKSMQNSSNSCKTNFKYTVRTMISLMNNNHNWIQGHIKIQTYLECTV